MHSTQPFPSRRSRARRSRHSQPHSDWNLLIRATSLAVALGITLVLIIQAMPQAPADPANDNHPQKAAPTLRWTAMPKANTPVDSPQTNADDLRVTGELPAGETSLNVPQAASGKTEIVAGSSPGSGRGKVYFYRVEVEQGLPIQKQIAARSIHKILNDPRGWGGPNHQISFSRTDGQADFRIVLASPTLTDSICAPLATRGSSNCRNGSNVVLNARRWINGAAMWKQLGKSLTDYRIYEVSHETGHWLGHGHLQCSSAGALAPTMMQQTSDAGNNKGCIPNGWPNPNAK